MELQDQGETVLFKNGVTLERGTDELRAKRMSTNKGRDRISASGNVQLVRKLGLSEKIKGFGSAGFYDTTSGEGYLTGGSTKTHVVYTKVMSSTSTRVIDVYADRFDFSKQDSTAVASGHVYGRTRDPDTLNLYEFWSDSAVFQDSEKKVVLSGQTQPFVREIGREGERNVLGDIITYFYEGKHFISTGNARAVLQDLGRKRL